MRRTATLGAVLALACTPDIATDPLPETAQFEPTAVPARVAEPSFLAIDRATGRIDLGLAGIDVPAVCPDVGTPGRAPCEFNQYLESLDGFPSTAAARTPMSAAVDLASVQVPQTLAVIAANPATQAAALLSTVKVGFDAPTGYLQITPQKGWPTGGFIWLGLRGYDQGIRAAGHPVVASVTYNLLKREEALTCAPVNTVITDPAAIPPACPYLQLLSQQMDPVVARASLLQLEQIRMALGPDPAMGGLAAWATLAAVGGIPKSEAAILWGFPVHSAPVIDLDPATGQVPQVVGADEIRLAVNGPLDPATVTAFRIAANTGSVYLLDLAALAAGELFKGFPAATASYVDGTIVIKTAAPLVRGGLYAIVVSRAAKAPTGVAMVSPPISVLLMAQGPLVDAAGKSLVSSVADADAGLLEVGRQQLAPLLEDPRVRSASWQRREDIAYLYAFTVAP